MSSTVALILRLESAIAFEALARCMPVWILSTPTHLHLKASLDAVPNAPEVTTLNLRENESLEGAAIRISFSLDAHYNEQVKGREPYKFLLLFGVQYRPPMNIKLSELGFNRFEATEFGFAASK
jgi:hypothetical protein